MKTSLKSIIWLPAAGMTILLTLSGLAVAAPAPSADTDPRDPALRRAYEKAIYSVKDAGHGMLRGSNEAQHLGLEFDSAGAKLMHADGTVRLRLEGIGYGGELAKPEAAKPKAKGTRVEYRRGNVTEWYENGPSGLEQGFTLAKRPVGGSEGEPLEFSIAVSGGLKLSREPGRAVFSSANGSVLRYGGLTAFDADGRTLPSRLEARGQEIRLIVDESQARYPVVVDPIATVTETASFTDSGSAAAADFGRTAISGTVAVVGAYNQTNGSTTAVGAAYVFTYSGGSWTQQAELTPPSGDVLHLLRFGFSVAVNGTTVIVGAYNANGTGATGGPGAAYVYTSSDSTNWTLSQTLTPPSGQKNDCFGIHVAMNANTAVIGARGRNSQTGSAFVYTLSGGTWSEQAELTASDAATSDVFGYGVAISSGGTIAVGAAGKNSGQGAVYIFTGSGASWSQVKITASDGAASDSFGQQVGISGNMMVTGGYQKTIGGNSQVGEGYIYTYNGSSWVETKIADPNGAAYDAFGINSAITGTTPSTATVLISANFNGGAGGVYKYTYNGSAWGTSTLYQEASATSGDNFGNVKSLAIDGTAAIVGAFTHNSGVGAAYVFGTPTVTGNLSISATHSSPIYQSGPGSITLTVTNSGGATAGAATISDTINSAFTINSVSSGCSATLQVVTCTLASGSSAASTSYTIYVTAASNAGASISNSATLSDSSDTVTTGTSNDTITVTAAASNVDVNLSQVSISGSTDGGTCATNHRTLTANVIIKNNGSTYTNPYPANITLTQGDTLNSSSVSGTSWANNTNLTFTFHIALANCNNFHLSFDVLSN